MAVFQRRAEVAQEDELLRVGLLRALYLHAEGQEVVHTAHTRRVRVTHHHGLHGREAAEGEEVGHRVKPYLRIDEDVQPSLPHRVGDGI